MKRLSLASLIILANASALNAQSCPTIKRVSIGPSGNIISQTGVATVARIPGIAAGNFYVNFSSPWASSDSYTCNVTVHTGSGGGTLGYMIGYPKTNVAVPVTAQIPGGAFADPLYSIDVICVGD